MTRERKEEIKRYLKERNIPITSLEANSIIEGVAWADAHPDRKRELRDEATEREVAFCDAWFAENNQFPTFGHAIEWADRTMVERASAYYEGFLCPLLKDYKKVKKVTENFKKAMGYNELKVEN